MIFYVFLCQCKEKKDPKTVNFPKTIIYAHNLPKKENFWIFILAGQSNMAGRGLVEPQDTIPNPKILTMSNENIWLIAKEPLHLYEPKMTGLDLGLSFGKKLLEFLPDNIYIGLVPCAIGGSSIEQWLGDSLFRTINLLSNFKNKTMIASKEGTIKGILWHQGENNANQEGVIHYKHNVNALFNKFRLISRNDTLPIIVGELGSFLQATKFSSYPDTINRIYERMTGKDRNILIVYTKDLAHKGDHLHFDSRSLRLLGNRFAETYSNHYLLSKQKIK